MVPVDGGLLDDQPMTETSSLLRDIPRRAHAINLAHILGDKDEVTALLVALHDRHGLDDVATDARHRGLRPRGHLGRGYGPRRA